MTGAAHPSFTDWYREGPYAPFVYSAKSAGGFLNLFGSVQPGSEVNYPAMPDLVLHQALTPGTRVSANLGGGRFNVAMEVGGFVIAAPNFAIQSTVPTVHEMRSFAFPMAQWQSVLDEASDGRLSFDSLRIYRGAFTTPSLQGKLRRLWSLCEEEGTPSRLLARAAGCEILAELCQLGGAELATPKGGLATWAERRCIELMRARLADDISLDELAAEAKLSPFHFARMFKQTTGMPPRVYLTQLRLEKACELLEKTDLSIMEIALEVGYSSSQVLARVFLKHQNMSASDYRRAVRDPTRIYGRVFP
ncbi:AraC family transcriptional regulator [Halodurantibacterium flavum]|uniref:Helix-turn-helix domain-containing protein n=1 Tax=Halodurantibacterium flavum TaxID=1382802 RepID=A0ABW4S080_9RHOB